MKAISILTASLLIGLFSCKDCDQCPEPTNYEYDPSDTRYICKVPEISRNIVGSWKYETNLDSLSNMRTGYVTFDATNRVIDPDSLFENDLDGAKVIAKIFAIKEGKVEVYQYIRTAQRPDFVGQTYPFAVQENACNRIKLMLPGTPSYVILTR